MNNFIVAPHKEREFHIWFIIATTAIILSYIGILLSIFNVDSGFLATCKRWLETEWVSMVIDIANWVSFVWILGQMIVRIPTNMKWLKGALWIVFGIYVIRVLFGYIIPTPEASSPSFSTYQTVHGSLNDFYTAASLIFGYLLVRNHGGRMKQLGIAIMVWQLLPILFNIMIIALPALSRSNTWVAIALILQLVVTIAVYYFMRQVFVPAWKETGKKVE